MRLCTRKVGHAKDHIAHDVEGVEMCRWPRTYAEKKHAALAAAKGMRIYDAARKPGVEVAAVADFVAADAIFLGHVDELLRWAQGHTDRDLLRDRVCRALGPLLRERMGRKLG